MKHSAILSLRPNTSVQERFSDEPAFVKVFKGLFSKNKVRIHEETFSASDILTKLHLAFKNSGINNIVRLSHDDIDFYLDEKSIDNDLTPIIKEFKKELDSSFERYFDEITFVLESQIEDLLFLIEVQLNRVHPIGEFPIKINFIAIPKNSAIDDINTKFMLYVNKIEQECQKYLNLSKVSINFIKSNEPSFESKEQVDIRVSKPPKSPFFPLNGISLGETSLKELQRKGKIANEIDAELKPLNYYTVRKMKVWHNNKVASYIYLTCLEEMPRPWKRLGLKWDLSYNQFIHFFEDLGYFINVTIPPKTSWYLGKKTLVAEFQAIATISKNLQYVFELYFNYSKKDSIDDRETFYSLKVIAN